MKSIKIIANNINVLLPGINIIPYFQERTQELYTELSNYTRNLVRTQQCMAHDSIGCIKLLNRDLLHTVNIIENFGFHHVGLRRRVRESV